MCWHWLPCQLRHLAAIGIYWGIVALWLIEGWFDWACRLATLEIYGNLGIDRRQNNRLHGQNISKRVLDFLIFFGCCSISSWVLQIKELIEEDANRRCKIPLAFQRGTVGNTTAVLVMSPNQEPGPGDSDWDRRCKNFQLLTCQLKRQICAPTSSATFKMRLEFRVPATEPYKIWMMVPSILIVWRTIDEDGPNDHCVLVGTSNQRWHYGYVVFLRKLDS